MLKKDKTTLIKALGMVGALLWALTIFLRGTNIAQNEVVDFLLGIAPNFGVGLLIPTLIIAYYPIIFKKDISFKQFILMIVASYILIFASEVIHDKFLNSRFDIWDMAASLVGFGIMVVANSGDGFFCL